MLKLFPADGPATGAIAQATARSVELPWRTSDGAAIPMAQSPPFFQTASGTAGPNGPDCSGDAEVVAGLKRLADTGMYPTLIFDGDGRVRYFNRAFRGLAQVCAREAGDARPLQSLADLKPGLVPPAAIEAASSIGEWSGEVFIAQTDQRPIVLRLQLLRLTGEAMS